MAKRRSILIINPNSTESMTDSLRPLVHGLGFDGTDYTFFTAPSGPKSINDEYDAALSAEHCRAPLEALLGAHDAFLVCCYSRHPLVGVLGEAARRAGRGDAPVTGIFEASVGAALQSLRAGMRFGIISTGSAWEGILTDAVGDFLGVGDVRGCGRFVGVETTGLNATELHDVPADVVRGKMKEATKRCVGDGTTRTICLGCAGMAGMDEMVREACVEELGEAEGNAVEIIDGVQAGVAYLQGALRARRRS